MQNQQKLTIADTTIGIVILNYLNYQDTIECIESIQEMHYKNVEIIIVDNGSDNESLQVLRRLYHAQKNIHLLGARKNYGFAKGNNIGINYARNRLNLEFIFCVNNDVIFTDPDYFDNLLSCYEEDVAVIGSRILLRNNKTLCWVPVDASWRGIFLTFLGILCLYLEFDKSIADTFMSKCNEKDKMLHGCALLFTPCYFKYASGFYPYTFLYAEEIILFLLCKKYGIKQKLVMDTAIFHKEDCSSEMSFGNDSRVKSKWLLWGYLNAMIVKLKTR